MLGILSWMPSWLQFTLVLFSFAFVLLYYYFTMKFNYWKDRGVPFVKPYPFVGSVSSLFTLSEHIHQLNQRIYKQFQGHQFVGFFQSRNPALMILDPELVKQVMVKDFTYFTDHGFKIHEDADPLEAKNLFNMNGDRWRQMRIKLTPTFTSGRMKAMYPLVFECAEKLEQHLGKLAQRNEEFEVKDMLSRYTTDVIGSCAFGIECNSLEDPTNEFRVMGKRAVDMDFFRALKTAIIIFMPDAGVRLRLAFIDKETTEYFRNMVRDVIEMRKKTGIIRKDFMQLLIELKEKGKIASEDGEEIHQEDAVSKLELTHDDITAQALVFFVAGFETSSTVMSFTLLELAVNPDVQRRLQLEIDEAIQQHDGQLTYQTIQDIKYLDWVLNETMRKYPPVSSHIRICTKNYTIPGTKVTIDEGTMLAIPVHAIQNDPKYFPDPERFDPERFSSDETSQKNKYIYTPFGEGPRMCIGNRFALMQSKLGLISVLRKYDVLQCAKTKYPADIDPKAFIMTTKQGIWIKLTPRSN